MSAVSSAVEAAITGPELVSALLTVVQQLDLVTEWSTLIGRDPRDNVLLFVVYAIKTQRKAFCAFRCVVMTWKYGSERIYYRRVYAIKTQRKASNASQ